MDQNDSKGKMSRRDFAKSTAAVVGTLMASQFPMTASAFYGVDDSIRVGLIGCGGRGTGAAVQALNAHPNVKLVAMADAFQDRLEDSLKNIQDEAAQQESGNSTMAERIDVPEDRRFVGFEAYKEVIPLVDVVILATPPGFRPSHFEAAVEAGKHIFMEKPVATDAPGVRRVLAANEKALEKKLNVVVGLQRHYQTVYREWVQRLQDGVIGDIILSRVYWNQDGVWVHPRKPGQTEMEYQMRNWYYFNWLCGDHIVEQHIHNIDVANWVKQGYPVHAQGQGGRLVRTGPDYGEIYDHHFVEFPYEDGTRMLSQCRHMPGTASRVTEAFHGTTGTAPHPGEIRDAKGNVIWSRDTKGDPNPYQVEHNELFDAISKGEFRFTDGENGAKATLTAIMGRMATYSGQDVTWDMAMNSKEDLSPPAYDWSVKLPDPPVAVPGKTKFA